MDGLIRAAAAPRRNRRAAPGAQLTLDVAAQTPATRVFDPTVGLRAIEDDAFPFELLSDTAEAESWRKEIHRPIHYIHKWWARRLGTVFRAVTLGALAPAGTDVMRALYEPVRFPDATIFDPFMGSGVTVAEALKLGTRAIGRDINPVAHFLVRNALRHHDRPAVIAAFEQLERSVSARIRHYYRAKLPDGHEGETLYYFWVKHLPCPNCGNGVDLFSSRIFAQHAYAKKFPRSQASCPGCGEINEVRYDATAATCRRCTAMFDPQSGPAKGQHASCPACGHQFSIANVVRQRSEPPSHRLYAKLVLTPGGKKVYLPPDGFDHALYAEAGAALAEQDDPYPIAGIVSGYNTDQALGYQYRYWHQFFNARQLLCLSFLADAIRAIEDHGIRDLMVCLFSGTLEFNNMFASFKGEGTGAVRHMFSHHILKPERVPLEANLWGTPASSGSFSGLFVSRILRALDYAENPTEIRVAKRGSAAEKVAHLADPIGYDPAESFAEFRDAKRRLYLSCDNSAATDIDDSSVDAVITDPPFFDNVHYSQLADFFHVWQRHILGPVGARLSATTRATGEVQDEDGNSFARKLGNVLAECRRVLKPDGMLAFSYHHSRDEGWSAVLDALMRSGLRITAAHPVKAEMSVAQPKAMAKEPIDLDIIVVCRKQRVASIDAWNARTVWAATEQVAVDQIARLTGRGRLLSRNDIKVIVMAQAIRRLSEAPDVGVALDHLADGAAAAIIAKLHKKFGAANSANVARDRIAHNVAV